MSFAQTRRSNNLLGTSIHIYNQNLPFFEFFCSLEYPTRCQTFTATLSTMAALAGGQSPREKGPPPVTYVALLKHPKDLVWSLPIKPITYLYREPQII